MISKPISRRSFLKLTGLTLAVSVTPLGYKVLNASAQDRLSTFKPNAWFEVTPDNLVTIYIPSSEMGQGIRTALAMIIAEELEADWNQIRVKQAPAADPFKNPLLGGQVTVASASVRGWYEPFRKAGASARAMLVAAAAQNWAVPEGECESSLCSVRHKKSGRSCTYGDVCLKAATLQVPQNVALKNENDFRYLGKSMPRLDIPEKVSGKGVYGLDVDVPDMLYAVTARPPAYGAKPLSYDQKAAEAVKGVQKVLPTPNGIAVCAESLYAALKGRDALQVKWDQGTHPGLTTESVESHYREGLGKPGAVVTNEGDAKKALGEASKKIEATYYVPFVAHSTMEPMNCTAHVQKDRCDVWVPTQGQTATLMTAANITGLPPNKINVNTTLLGCGLGRRSRPDFVIDALVPSKATGKPVKAVWSREEDLAYDAFRAATCQRIQAGLDDQGRVTAWSHKIHCTSILKFSNPAGIKNGVDIYSLWGIFDYPNSPQLSRTAYEFPNFYLEQVLSDLPIPAAPWRSVQNAPNAFVAECFMDELAHAAGKDPLEFRMHLLQKNMRVRRVLETVAEKAGWGKAVPKGKGRGIAQHTCFGSYLAMVADVSVKENGAVKVDRIVAAVDCGPVVNPDPIVAQVEGGVVMGVSTTLKEQIEFDKGGVKTSNFDDYQLLRMSEVPEIEVTIVKSVEKLGGIGEPGVPPVAPAIANAVFNATGARIRRLPLTAKTVLDAMKNKT